MWDLIVSVPDRCLSFYFTPTLSRIMSRCIVLYCKHQFCRMNHVKLLQGSLK